MAEKEIRHWWHSKGHGRDLSPDALRRLTRDYWRRNGSLEQRIEWYVEKLLPEELKRAEKRGALEFHRCDTPALLKQ